MESRAIDAARILIIDDEAANVQLLERLLMRAGYVRLRSTTDSRQAADLYREFQPDLVLLDLRMPHRDGFEILADLRRLIRRGSPVPILVLTADTESTTVERALRSGATDFLTKPFHHQEVLLRIRNLLETRFLHLALQRQNEDLEAQVEQRTRQVLQLEKMSAMGQLLAEIAHELNNPLAIVIGQAQLLLEESGRARTEEGRVVKIARAAQRCARVVQNLLALVREHAPELVSLDLNAVVREAIDLVSHPPGGEGVEVRFDLADALPPMWGDPHQLQQVVINLVANASDAMAETSGPRILTVITRPSPGPSGVELRVRDTGHGIPLEIQERIFEPFFTTKPPGQGTGLGLSLSLELVRGHGGSIRVESAPGHGATFIVDLPVGAGPAPEASGPPLTAEPGAVTRILVVDDEPEVAELLAELLRFDGHVVETARNGAEALDRLARARYDAILTDTKMPVLDGRAFFRELLRHHPEMRGRVCFVTGDLAPLDDVDFPEGAGVPYLAKPFGLDEVRRIVARLLRTA